MKKLLMLGTSHASCELVKYAKSKGIYTIVTDYLPPEKSVAKLIADEYWMMNTGDLDGLEKKCREEEVNGIICGVSEFNLEVTMELCKRLGLQSYCTPEAWSYSRDKSKFKALCKREGVPMATDYHVSKNLTEEELAHVKYPVVVKPVDLSGNRGISYCYTKEELKKAYKYALSVSKSDKIIVERMLRGQQVSGYYAISDGEIHLISLSSMNSEPGYPKNCYSITTSISDLVDKYIEEENDLIIKVLKAVGCKEGICWVELIYDEDGHFYLLEMGYRLPGDMIFLPLKGVCGFDTVKWLVDYALGAKRCKEDLPLKQMGPYKKCAVVYMLWNKIAGKIASINGFDKFGDMPNVIVDFLPQVGDVFPEYRPLGEITFYCDTVDEVNEMIRKVNDTVSVINTEGENMLIYYTDFAHLKKMESY